MRVIYSNKAAKLEEYVEVTLDDRVALRHMGQNIVGISVSSGVWSRSPQYDELVDFNKNHTPEQRAEAEALLRTVARQYGLTEDVGLTHRRKLWSV
jgi:hypothetical protein